MKNSWNGKENLPFALFFIVNWNLFWGSLRNFCGLKGKLKVKENEIHFVDVSEVEWKWKNFSYFLWFGCFIEKLFVSFPIIFQQLKSFCALIHTHKHIQVEGIKKKFITKSNNKWITHISFAKTKKESL